MDQRTEGRYSVDVDVDIRMHGDSPGWSESTVTSNVSPHGICFYTTSLSRYPVGQHVDLWIGLSSASGEVEWVSKEGVVTWKSDDDISTCGELIRPRVGVTLASPIESLLS